MNILRPGLNVEPLPGPASFRAESRIGEIAGVKVWKNHYGRGVSYTAEKKIDGLIVLVPYSGVVNVPGLISQPVGQNHILSLLDEQIERLDYQEGTRTEGILIAMPQLSSQLEQRLDRPLKKPLSFNRVHEAATGPAVSVRLMLAALMRTLLNPLSLRDGTALRSASTTLIDLILEVLPHSFSDAMRAPAPHIAPRQVRRAIAYIHESPTPVLSVHELAAICNVSARSLQYAFRDFVGVTPSEYWRKVRRDQAIAQLRREPSASISQVASAWGFSNVTRFRASCAEAGAEDLLRRTFRAGGLAPGL